MNLHKKNETIIELGKPQKTSQQVQKNFGGSFTHTTCAHAAVRLALKWVSDIMP